MTTPETSSLRDVLFFDCSRGWLNLALRRLSAQGLRPKLLNTTTGLGLADWKKTGVAVFDVGHAWERSLRAIRWLARNQAHVRAIAVTDGGMDCEWLLREAGATLVIGSVFEVQQLVRTIFRIQSPA